MAMIRKMVKAGMKQALPKGRITPVFKSSMKTTTPMMSKKAMPKMIKRGSVGGAVSANEVKMLQKRMPKKGAPMNWKNKNYKPSNGVGVGY